jgi:hypothetical protein
MTEVWLGREQRKRVGWQEGGMNCRRVGWLEGGMTGGQLQAESQ